jgi:hypothetical protein
MRPLGIDVVIGSISCGVFLSLSIYQLIKIPTQVLEKTNYSAAMAQSRIIAGAINRSRWQRFLRGNQ